MFFEKQKTKQGTTFKQTGILRAVHDFLIKSGAVWVKAYRSNDGRAVMVSVNKTPHGELKHVSVSRSDRHPSWDEIVEVKEHFIGTDVDAMMVIPKREDYVNLQEHCFHVWQTPVAWNIR